ncbi:MAG: phosphoribosylglycinamide formyltransferase [Acidobacteriota bacterium]
MTAPPGPTEPTPIGILLSGRGSNFLALYRAIEAGEVPARIALVLSNKEEAKGLQKARELGLEVAVLSHRGKTRKAHDRLVVEALRRAGVEWVCLAGYMRILSPVLVDAYPNRILNIHPSLLPAFPGLDAQRQAWDYGVRVAGCTVHLVDHGLDSGPIVMQKAIDADSVETAEALSKRILEEEHQVYPRALGLMIRGSWRIEGRRVVFLEESA